MARQGLKSGLSVLIGRKAVVGLGNVFEYLHFDGTSWSDLAMQPSADTWMFNGAEPNVANDSFAFSPDDVWSVGPLGAWRRRTPIP